jgi:hypothetical protein
VDVADSILMTMGRLQAGWWCLLLLVLVLVLVLQSFRILSKSDPFRRVYLPLQFAFLFI